MYILIQNGNSIINGVAVYVNSEVCMTNWRIGTRIKEDVLYNKRAEYGKQVVKNLSAQLTERYSKGWSEKTLRHCLRAAETFSEIDIVSAVQRQFSWTHLKQVSGPLDRELFSCHKPWKCMEKPWVEHGMSMRGARTGRRHIRYTDERTISAERWSPANRNAR